MGKAATKAQNKYIAKVYDRIPLVVPKGKKDELDTFIKSICPDKSRNQFINEAIEEKMEWEQEHYNNLPEGKKWYRSEDGRKAIEKLTEDKK